MLHSASAKGVTVKPFIFYIIIAWSTGPLVPMSQKTIILEFSTMTECESVAHQVELEVKASGSPFEIKNLRCFRCTDVYTKDVCSKPRPR